jgi:hypothetical protein
MRVVLTFLLLMIGGTAIAQQPLRNEFTTNLMMNAVQDGWFAVWNNTAKRWSNTLIGASATNAQPPSTVLTNLAQTGAITNLNDNQFAAETTIAAIKDGAVLTNINVYAPGTMNVFGPLQVTSSFIATGPSEIDNTLVVSSTSEAMSRCHRKRMESDGS